MAASFTPRASLVPSQVHTNEIPGNWFEDDITVTGDSSYPAGGYAFGNTQLQTMYGGAYSTLRSVEVVNPWVTTTPTSFIAAWIPSTGKLAALTQAVAGAATAQAEITAGTNLTTFSCTIRIRFC